MSLTWGQPAHPPTHQEGLGGQTACQGLGPRHTQGSCLISSSLEPHTWLDPPGLKQTVPRQVDFGAKSYSTTHLDR